jgi:hypothetical protein
MAPTGDVHKKSLLKYFIDQLGKMIFATLKYLKFSRDGHWTEVFGTLNFSVYKKL